LAGYDLRNASFVFAALRVLQNTLSPRSLTVVVVPPVTYVGEALHKGIVLREL